MFAFSFYWPMVFAVGAGGLLLIVWTLVRRRGWWWKLPLSLAMVVGPYAGDVVRERMSGLGESPVNAAAPTTVLLMMMEPDTAWPYGIVFDRLNKSPRRHALWSWQLDRLAQWCDRCVASKDGAMGRRGVQIAGNIAGRGSDEAVRVLARAMMHADAATALLAFDSLHSMGDRVVHARAEIEAVARESKDPAVKARAAILLALLK